MDAILAAANARRSDLLKELEKVDHFLETYHTLSIELKLESENKKGTQDLNVAPKKVVDGEQMEAAREAQTSDDAPAKRIRVSDNPSPALVVQAAAEVIRAKGRPMSRRSIHTALKEQGIHVKGADEVKSLGTMLWRSGKEVLVQIEGKGYGLKGVDYDSAQDPEIAKVLG